MSKCRTTLTLASRYWILQLPKRKLQRFVGSWKL